MSNNSICWDIQSDSTLLECDLQGSVLLGKVTVVLSNSLQSKYFSQNAYTTSLLPRVSIAFCYLQYKVEEGNHTHF